MKNNVKLYRIFFISIFLFFLFSYIIYSNLQIGILIVILFLLCTYRFIYQYINDGKIHIFDLRNLISINYFFILGFGYYAYLMRCYFGFNPFTHSKNDIIEGILYAIIGIFSFNIVIEIATRIIKQRKDESSFKFKKVFKQKWFIWLVLILIIALFFLYLWMSMGGIPIFIENYHQSERATIGKGLGYMEALCKSLVSISIIYFIIKFKEKYRNTFFDFFIIATIFLLYVLGGDRGGAIFYFMNLWIVFYIFKNKPSLTSFLKIISAIVIIAGFLGALRSDRSKSVLLVSSIIVTEMSVEFDNYIETIKNFRNEPYLNGSTLVPIITIPIPRAIFPEKDAFKTAGVFFKEYHNHTYIRVGERISYLGELYMNWGIIGIVIGMMFLGFITVLIQKILYIKENIIKIYLYIIFVFFCFSLIAGDIATAVISLGTNNLIFFIFYFLIKILVYNKQANYNPTLTC